MDGLNTTEGIMALAAAGLGLLALVIAIVALAKLRGIRSAQTAVLGGTGTEDLIEHAARTSERVDELQQNVDNVSRALLTKIDEIDVALAASVAHTAVIRYDAFNESSGRQSSSIAILDRHGDGMVISAILQREQARVYAKAVTDGRSKLELSPEEAQAVAEALGGTRIASGG